MNDTTENNRLIAEFMGVESNYFPQHGEYVNHYGNASYIETFYPEDMKYHADWNWLMPVVEKIEASQPEGFNTLIEGRNCWIEAEGVTFEGNSPTSKIEAAYSAVVEFIKWHNEKLKENASGTGPEVKEG